MFLSACPTDTEVSGRAGYPPVATKPSVAPKPALAPKPAEPYVADDAAQNSPVVVKRAVTVQSSRPGPAAQQGESRSGHKHNSHSHFGQDQQNSVAQTLT